MTLPEQATESPSERTTTGGLPPERGRLPREEKGSLAHEPAYAFLVLDRSSRVTFLNDAAAAFLDVSAPRAVGRTIQELGLALHPADGRSRNAHAAPVEATLASSSGAPRRLTALSAPVRDANEGQGTVLVLGEDAVRGVGDERAAELASLVESSNDAIIGKRLDSTVTTWNAAAEALFGWSAAEMIGRSVTVIYPPSRLKEEALIIERVARGERIRHYETERLRKDGSLISVSLSVSPIRSHGGRIVGVSSILRDITEQRRAAESLKKASVYARSLIEASLDPLVTISPDGKITDVNKATEVVTGVGRKRLVGSDFAEYFTDPGKAREGYRRAFNEGTVTDYPLAIRHASGRVTHVLYNATVYRDESGEVQGVFAAARDISERKEAEEKLREASSYARSLIEASLDPLVTISPEGKITDVNSATERLTGVPRRDLVGSDFSDYFTEPDKARAGYKKAFREGIVTDYPLALRRADGRPLHVLYNAAVYEDDNGNVQGVFAAARDVTSRRTAENELRAASEYARSLIEASLDPFVTINTEGKITDVNKATELITGIGRKKLVGSDFSDYFTEPEKARAGYKQVFKEGVVRDYPLRLRHVSGRVTPVLYNATVFRDENGVVQGCFAAARDITERERAEQQLKKASDYARSLIEASLDPLVTISTEGKITDVNKATELATGLPRELLIGSDFSDYFTEPDKARAGYKQVFQEGVVKDYPLALRHASGAVTDVVYNATVYEDDRGNIQGVFAAARDVTERKKAEQLIKSASDYARSLIEASLDPLVTINADGQITDVNKATEVATGVPRGTLVGSDFSDYFTEPDKAREGYQKAFQEGVVTDYPLAIRHASGRVTHVLYNAAVYRDEAGRVQGVFAAARDITTRKASEDALYAKSSELTQSNADLEHFAYVASHDLKEPLRMVSSYVHLLQQKYGGKLDAKADQYIAFAVEGATRMQGLIDGLLEYSRVGAREAPASPVHLSEALESALKSLKATIDEKGAVVESDGWEDDPVVLGDAGLIAQLLQNLVANAIKFQKPGATPRVRVEAARSEEGWTVSVVDNGIGVDPEFKDQLFTLFRRLHSREEYPGSGIGLAVCKRIVERHGGQIWVESTPGEGAAFRFTLKEAVA